MQERKIYRDNKTNREYEMLIEWAILEKTLEPQVVCQSVKDGKIWVLPYKEFFNGRFSSVIN